MSDLQVDEFLKCISGYLYGFSDDTLKSLMLTVMPSESDQYIPFPLDKEPDEADLRMGINEFLLKTVAHAMQLSAGFNINLVSDSLITYMFI